MQLCKTLPQNVALPLLLKFSDVCPSDKRLRVVQFVFRQSSPNELPTEPVEPTQCHHDVPTALHQPSTHPPQTTQTAPATHQPPQRRRKHPQRNERSHAAKTQRRISTPQNTARKERKRGPSYLYIYRKRTPTQACAGKSPGGISLYRTNVEQTLTNQRFAPCLFPLTCL